MDELEEKREIIRNLNFSIEEQNQKIIGMEENIYEMETMQLDLVD